MTDLLDILTLEPIDANLFRSTVVFEEHRAFPLYGGQVAAQALRAAGETVDRDRAPHSLHGYFLRPGDSGAPTVFQVHRDRDGRSFSSRRVVAIQRGAVIFSMSASFHVGRSGPVSQAEAMPEVEAPEGLPPQDLFVLRSIEGRRTAQPYPQADWPSRFWARVTVDLPADPLVQACALTYLSDVSTGLLPAAGAEGRSSLDHAVWFHAPARMTDWVLSDYRPGATGQGRGWYTGSMFAADGALLASIAQESLFF